MSLILAKSSLHRRLNLHRWLLALCLPALILANGTPTAVAQATEAALAQKWHGTVNAFGAKLRLVMEFETADDGTISGKLISVDQGNATLVFDTVGLADGKLDLAVKQIMAKYSGDLSDSGKEIKGTWSQMGRDSELILHAGELPEQPAPTEIWVGVLNAGGAKLQVQFRIFVDEDGNREVLFDSLTQNANNITATQNTEAAGKLKFAIKMINAKYEGELDAAKKKAAGTWTQAGTEFPLTLELKSEPVSVKPPNRPQHPKAPFEYQVVDVTFDNPAADITLAGTLTMPNNPAKHSLPAVIMISGSGPQDRDETLMGHKPFLVIADHLTKKGVAVLRFDDRGVGDSTGDHSVATSADFATDVAAAVAFLKTRPEINTKRIGLVGHSEGGLIAPIVATKHVDDLAHLVLLAGPSVDGGEILKSQVPAIHSAMGTSADDIAALTKGMGKLMAGIRDGVSDDDFDALIETAVGVMDTSKKSQEGESSEKESDESESGEPDMMDFALRASASQFKTPWFRYFVAYDPAPTIAKVDCPMLALFGTKDLQVIPDINMQPMKDAFEKGHVGNKITLLDGLNHLFQHSDTGSPLEYQTIEETFAPAALDAIAEWVLAH